MSGIEIAVLVSELIACYIVWRLWKSDDYLLFKIGYSVIVFVPFLGPFFVLWSAKMPTRQPIEMRDLSKYTTDVFDRWRHVVNEKNPHVKFRLWKEMFNKEK